jgi:hypothetical protein
MVSPSISVAYSERDIVSMESFKGKRTNAQLRSSLSSVKKASSQAAGVEKEEKMPSGSQLKTKPSRLLIRWLCAHLSGQLVQPDSIDDLQVSSGRPRCFER